jgi:hypothetical protein
MNTQFRRRLSAAEVKVVPKLSPVEEKLCANDHFVALVSSLGLDIADLKRRGNVLGGLPRDVLRRVLARLEAAGEKGAT